MEKLKKASIKETNQHEVPVTKKEFGAKGFSEIEAHPFKNFWLQRHCQQPTNTDETTFYIMID